jgi:hypothetical protein
MLGYSGDDDSNLAILNRILIGIAKYLTDQKQMENQKIEDRELIQFEEVRFNKFEFVKILSLVKRKSSLQDLHTDYCPHVGPDDDLITPYKNYFDQVMDLGCFHLSALHFPTGGAFSYIQGDFESINKCVIDSFQKAENAKANLPIEKQHFQVKRCCEYC